MSRVQVALMNLAESLALPAAADSMAKLELAVRDLGHIRAATVPKAIFDGQLLAFAEEIIPLLHDSRYLGIPELAGRWHQVVAAISIWFEDTQGDDE
jgi:hypothetical protein